MCKYSTVQHSSVKQHHGPRAPTYTYTYAYISQKQKQTIGDDVGTDSDEAVGKTDVSFPSTINLPFYREEATAEHTEICPVYYLYCMIYVCYGICLWFCIYIYIYIYYVYLQIHAYKTCIYISIIYLSIISIQYKVRGQLSAAACAAYAPKSPVKSGRKRLLLIIMKKGDHAASQSRRLAKWNKRI